MLIKTILMTVRLIALRPGDSIASCEREIGHRGTGYVCWDRQKRVLLASQSVAKLANVIQQIVRQGGDFDPALDMVYSQAFYSLLNGTTKGQYTKGWRVEKLGLADLPTRFQEVQAMGFQKVGIVCSAETCWKMDRAC